MSTRVPAGRASTDDLKTQMMTLILALWKKFPHLRLGQLIDNATRGESLFYMEDADLLDMLSDFLSKHPPVN